MTDTDDFKNELIELMKKHNVSLDRNEQYDGNEEFSGYCYDFIGPHTRFNIENIL